MHLRRKLLAPYHYAWAHLSALWYGFPAKRLTIIGVTGTKGKSSVTEMLYAILTSAGHKTALAGTIRFAIGDKSQPNLFKMTMPGRGFIQRFLAEVLADGCTHAVVEITSEAVLQYRHLNLDLDGLVVTNIQREHIESHGSFEKYAEAKRAIVTTLEQSQKNFRVLVTNTDIPETSAFLSAKVSRAIGFSAGELSNISGDERSVSFEYAGIRFFLPITGVFNAMNAISAVKLCEALGVPLETSAAALAKLPTVRGRVEHIDEGQNFIAVVDYAHTPDSLKSLYGAFPNRQKICVLGNTGGGRDSWKRPEMGKIADEMCEKVILTNEDPYDEDPRAIVEAMARGMARQPEIIMDRREAIRTALRSARPGDAVLISGKGTDPFIMGPSGHREVWSDAGVVREELKRLLGKV